MTPGSARGTGEGAPRDGIARLAENRVARRSPTAAEVTTVPTAPSDASAGQIISLGTISDDSRPELPFTD